jgi:purine-binding chemotaxis protein CheW
MVDLVKIRKKKQKQKEEEAVAEERTATPPAAEPVAPPPQGGSAAAALQGAAATPAPETLSKLDRFKAEAGKRRETQVTQEEVAVEGELELLTFIIAGEQYAIAIERIIEIVTPRALTRVPNADQAVVGIMSLRGTIVTLVDVRRKLRHPPAGEATEDTRIIVIDYEREILGFLVDRVLRVVKARPGEIEPHPVVHATELEEAIQGVFRPSGALTILLDLDKLLADRAPAARST